MRISVLGPTGIRTFSSILHMPKSDIIAKAKRIGLFLGIEVIKLLLSLIIVVLSSMSEMRTKLQAGN